MDRALFLGLFLFSVPIFPAPAQSAESDFSFTPIFGVLEPETAQKRRSSGTSWQPEAVPHEALHLKKGSWTFMTHGSIALDYDRQGGPRGATEWIAPNWLMLSAERSSFFGNFELRSMLSLEPATLPSGGSAQLFQTGETFKGKELVNRQHPHDFFMELAARYTTPVLSDMILEIYGGLGEPALGPPAFMHRASAEGNLEAPLGHHWQDSTHISHGVVTIGLMMGAIKLEESFFHGREPDENRWNPEFHKLNSTSIRVTINPVESISFQVSSALLQEPEEAHPGVDVSRFTMSLQHFKKFKNSSLATSLIWGNNQTDFGRESDAILLESSFKYKEKNILFGRAETVLKEGLLDFSPSSRYRISAFTLGGVREIFRGSTGKLGLGAMGTVYVKPGILDPYYGRFPVSFHVFLRGKLGASQHKEHAAHSMH